MSYYLAIQNTYDAVQIALYKDQKEVANQHISKIEASKLLMPSLLDMLTQHELSWENISFIAANIGPGPFTTLRVVITTVNGIAYARSIPLIGIDSLKATLEELEAPKGQTAVILFNAFGNDVYALFKSEESEDKYGVFNIAELVNDLKNHKQPLYFVGNGALLHQDLIKDVLKEKATIAATHNYCSLNQIAKMGYHRWVEDNQGEKQLVPLYLKKHPMQVQSS